MSTIADITELMTSKLGPDLIEKTGQFIEGIAPIFSLGLSLYVVLLTFYYYNKGFDESIVDISKRVLVWLIIIAFAFNAGNYAKIAGIIYAMPDQLSSLFGFTHSGPNAVETGLQSIDRMIFSLDQISKDKAWYEIQTHLAVYGAKLITMILGYLLFMVAYAFYLIAKVCLALTLMIGPLFLGAALFPGTRQYAMNWIGQCLNYIVTIALLTLISVIQSSFVQSTVDDWANQSGAWDLVEAWKAISQLLVMTVIFLMAALSIPSIAGALTGGAMADSHSRTFGRMGGFVSRTFDKITNRGTGGSARGYNRASRD